MYSKRENRYACQWHPKTEVINSGRNDSGNNALRKFFDANKEGNGIWKFLHYFNIYEKHISKYIGKEVHIVKWEFIAEEV